jgi:nicotinamidase-related amidase
MSDIALLIIDMQVGNFSEPNPVYKGNELLTKVKRLITKGRSAQIPIIYVQNNGGSGDPTNMALQVGKSIPLSHLLRERSWFKSRLLMLSMKPVCTVS